MWKVFVKYSVCHIHYETTKKRQNQPIWNCPGVTRAKTCPHRWPRPRDGIFVTLVCSLRVIARNHFPLRTHNWHACRLFHSPLAQPQQQTKLLAVRKSLHTCWLEGSDFGSKSLPSAHAQSTSMWTLSQSPCTVKGMIQNLVSQVPIFQQIGCRSKTDWAANNQFKNNRWTCHPHDRRTFKPVDAIAGISHTPVNV